MPVELLVRGICALRPGVAGPVGDRAGAQRRRPLPRALAACWSSARASAPSTGWAAPTSCTATSTAGSRCWSASTTPPSRAQLDALLDLALADDVAALGRCSADGCWEQPVPAAARRAARADAPRHRPRRATGGRAAPCAPPAACSGASRTAGARGRRRAPPAVRRLVAAQGQARARASRTSSARCARSARRPASPRSPGGPSAAPLPRAGPRAGRPEDGAVVGHARHRGRFRAQRRGRRAALAAARPGPGAGRRRPGRAGRSRASPPRRPTPRRCCWSGTPGPARASAVARRRRRAAAGRPRAASRRRALARLLPAYGVARVLSAPAAALPARPCSRSPRPSACEVETCGAAAEDADPAALADVVRELARDGRPARRLRPGRRAARRPCRR